MSGMFYEASVANPDMSGWIYHLTQTTMQNINGVESLVNAGFSLAFNHSGLTAQNYSALLVNLAQPG